MLDALIELIKRDWRDFTRVWWMVIPAVIIAVITVAGIFLTMFLVQNTHYVAALALFAVTCGFFLITAWIIERVSDARDECIDIKLLGTEYAEQVTFLHNKLDRNEYKCRKEKRVDRRALEKIRERFLNHGGKA